MTHTLEQTGTEPGAPGGSAHPSVSVLVPTHQGADRLRGCLDSLAHQTLPPEQFEVLLVHNGPADGTREVVVAFCSDHPHLKVRVLGLRELGAGHARNLGLMFARGEWVTFVDDDDRVTPDFLSALLAAAEPGVIVATMIGDVQADSEPGTLPATDRYIGRGLGPRAGHTVDGHELVTAFSYNAAKLVNTELARSATYDTTLRSGEDHVYWLRLFAHEQFRFRVLDPQDGAMYLRTVRKGGVGSQETSYDFNVTQRLHCLAAIEQVDRKHPAVARVARGLMRGQASWLHAYLLDRPEKHARMVADVRALELHEFPWKEVNRGLARDLAISYCFPPDLDTSGVVAAKRLRERGLVTDVISQDLSRLRTFDAGSLRLAEEVIGRHEVIGGTAGFLQWRAMTEFADRAWTIVEEWEAIQGSYESVYSRAMAVNSHYAAALVKLRRPDIEWVAEFSDPLRLNAMGQERLSEVGDDWLSRELLAGVERAGFDVPEEPRVFAWAEQLTYALADRIVFTNEAQKEFMLGHCDEQALVDRARAISVVRHHPTLPRLYYDMVETHLKRRDSTVELAYFGVFYSTRDLGDVISALARLRQCERDRVRLHVFTTDPDALALQVVRAGLAGVVLARPYVPVLDFLSLTKQFDVLVVNDANTATHHSVNPYLPSKLADYVGSGTPVWAICEDGSVMSGLEVAHRSRLGDVEGSVEVLRALVRRLAAHATAC